MTERPPVMKLLTEEERERIRIYAKRDTPSFTREEALDLLYLLAKYIVGEELDKRSSRESQPPWLPAEDAQRQSND